MFAIIKKETSLGKDSKNSSLQRYAESFNYLVNEQKSST